MSGKRGGSSGRGRNLTYQEKSGLHFIKQDEPDFIKKMKSQMGYKEPAKLEDKFEDDHAEENPDDKDDDEFGVNGPQVVVLDPSKDLSRDELDKELAARKKEEDDRLIAEGKIVFRKPVKRTNEENSDATTDEKKKKTDVSTEDQPTKKVNTALLSFGDDEDEDE